MNDVRNLWKSDPCKLIYKPSQRDTSELKSIPFERIPLNKEFDSILSPDWIINLVVKNEQTT